MTALSVDAVPEFATTTEKESSHQALATVEESGDRAGRKNHTHDLLTSQHPAFGQSLLRFPSPDAFSELSFDDNGILRHGPTSHTIQPVGRDANRSTDSSKSMKVRLQEFWIRNKGLGLVMLAQFFGSTMNVTTRILEKEGNNGKGMHPFQILFARMTITVFLASLYMYRNKTPDFPFGKPEVRLLLVARGVGGFFGVFGMYYSLLYLPLADATVITFLAPGITCWVCSYFINEPFTRMEQIAAYISLFGVVLIARPTSFFTSSSGNSIATGNPDLSGFTNGTASAISAPNDAYDYSHITPGERAKGVAVAMLGVLGAVCAFTTLRWIGPRAHALISVNYFATWCTIVSTFMMLVLPDVGFLLPANVKEWALLIFLGTCGFIMQYLLASGLQYEKSSRATNMTYTQMLFALGFDKVFFGVSPGWLSIAGSSLILGSAIYVAAMKQSVGRDSKPNYVPVSQLDEELGQTGHVQEQARHHDDNELDDLIGERNSA